MNEVSQQLRRKLSLILVIESKEKGPNTIMNWKCKDLPSELFNKHWK